MSCIDTLRLSPAEQSELLDYLESADPAPDPANLRQHPRMDYSPSAGIVISLAHPGGSVALYLVQPRNISAGGIGFLHGRYLHQGSPCGLALRTVTGERRTLRGRVAWCRHVRGHVHEVGIAFEERIDTRQFVDTCLRMTSQDAEGHAAEAGEATSIPMPDLQGRVLHVEDAVDDQALLQFQLGQLGVELHTVASTVEALRRLENERFDLVLTSLWLRDAPGLEWIEQACHLDEAPPILALTADPAESLHAEARQCGCAHVLVKPYTFATLVEALTPYLAVPPAVGDDAEPEPEPAPAPEPESEPDSESEPLVSGYWLNRTMRPLIRRYVARLEEQMAEIAPLLADSPHDPMLRKLVLEMKGSAGSYGYPALSEAAHRLYVLIEHQADAEALDAAQAHVAALVRAAKRGITSAE